MERNAASVTNEEQASDYEREFQWVQRTRVVHGAPALR